MRCDARVRRILIGRAIASVSPRPAQFEPAAGVNVEPSGMAVGRR
jgi:hypothetical protein